MSERAGTCEGCDWPQNSKWITRSIEELQEQSAAQQVTLTKISTDIETVVRVAKMLGWLLGIVGTAGLFEILKRLLASFASLGTAAAIIYFS